MRIALFAICFAIAGCSTPAHRVFRGGSLPDWWDRVDADSDLAFRSEHGATIYANVDCEQVDDAPLDVLTNHLLFGVDVNQEQRSEMTLAGRKALRTLVDGEVDGVPVRLDTIVMMKDGCTYDLALIAGPETFERHQADFEEFVRGFETVDVEKRAEEPEKEGWACSVVPC